MTRLTTEDISDMSIVSYLRDESGGFAYPDSAFPDVEAPFPGLPLSPQARIAKITAEFEDHVHSALVHGTAPDAMSTLFRWAREALDFAEYQPGLGFDVIQAAIDIVEITEKTPDAQFRGAALYMMGLWHLFGLFERQQDTELAMALFMMSAETGFSRALYRIGSDFERRGDCESAKVYFEHGVKRGDAACCYRMSMAYLRGHLGCKIDRNLGLRYLETSSLMSDPDSPQCAYVFGLVQLGELPDVLPLRATDDELQRESGLMAVERAAWLGFKPAQMRMGKEWQGGMKGFDSAVALRYFHLASRQEQYGIYRGSEPPTLGGAPEAEISKWFLCGSTDVFPPNEEWAYKFACVAAEQENKVAEFAVGYFYEIGIYVDQDISLARKWYGKSASHGCQDAAERLKEIGDQESEKPRRTLTRKDHEQSMVKRGRGSTRSSRRPVPSKEDNDIGRMTSSASLTPRKVTTDCNTVSPLPRRPIKKDWVTNDSIALEPPLSITGPDVDVNSVNVERLNISSNPERRQGEAKTALQLTTPRRRPVGKGHKKHSSIAVTNGLIADSSFQQTRNNARKTSIPVQMLATAGSTALSLVLDSEKLDDGPKSFETSSPLKASQDLSLDSSSFNEGFLSDSQTTSVRQSPVSSDTSTIIAPTRDAAENSGSSTPATDSRRVSIGSDSQNDLARAVAPLCVSRKSSQESVASLVVARKPSLEHIDSLANNGCQSISDFEGQVSPRKGSASLRTPSPRKSLEPFVERPEPTSPVSQTVSRTPSPKKSYGELVLPSQQRKYKRRSLQSMILPGATSPGINPAVEKQTRRSSDGSILNRTPSPKKSSETIGRCEPMTNTTAPLTVELDRDPNSTPPLQLRRDSAKGDSPDQRDSVSNVSSPRKRRSGIYPVLPTLEETAPSCSDDSGAGRLTQRERDETSKGLPPDVGSDEPRKPTPSLRSATSQASLSTALSLSHTPVSGPSRSVSPAKSIGSVKSRSSQATLAEAHHLGASLGISGGSPAPGLSTSPSLTDKSSPALSSDASIFSRASTMTSGITSLSELSEFEPGTRPGTAKSWARTAAVPPLPVQPLAKKSNKSKTGRGMTFDDMGIKIADKDEKEDCIIM